MPLQLQCLHLTPWMHGPFLYTGSLTGLNITGRWNINAMARQTGYVLNICSSGYGYTTGVNGYETGVCRFYQSGTGYGQKVLDKIFISPPLASGKLIDDFLYSGLINCASRGASSETGYFSLYGNVLVMGSGGNLKSTIATFEGERTFSSGFRPEKISQNYNDSSYTTQLGDRLVIELGVKSLNTTAGYKVFQTAVSSYDKSMTATPFPVDWNKALPSPSVPNPPDWNEVIKRYLPETPPMGRESSWDDSVLAIEYNGPINVMFPPDEPPQLYTEVYSDKACSDPHYVATTGCFENEIEFGVSSSMSGDALAENRNLSSEGYMIKDGMLSPNPYKDSSFGKGIAGGAGFAGNPWYENVSLLYSYASAAGAGYATTLIRFKRRR